jgi:hypothetical protein
MTHPGSALAAALLVLASLQTPSRDPLAAIRDAIGGDVRIRAIKSLSLEGTFRTTQVVRQNRDGVTQIVDRSTQVELLVLFPDHYLRIEKDERVERFAGFAGADVLNDLRAIGQAQVASVPGADALERERLNAVRLIAGMIGRTDLQPGTTARGAYPRVTLAAGDAFNANLEIDPATKEVKLVYRARQRVYQPGAILQGARMGGAGVSTAPEEDVTVTFADRRPVDGVLVPHHITTTAKGVLLNELKLTSVRVNPGLTPASFRR